MTIRHLDSSNKKFSCGVQTKGVPVSAGHEWQHVFCRGEGVGVLVHQDVSDVGSGRKILNCLVELWAWSDGS